MSYMNSFVGYCNMPRKTKYGNFVNVEGGNVSVKMHYIDRIKLKGGDILVLSASSDVEFVEISYCWNDNKMHYAKTIFNYSMFLTYIPRKIKDPELHVFTKVKFSDGLVSEHKHKFNIHEINAM